MDNNTNRIYTNRKCFMSELESYENLNAYAVQNLGHGKLMYKRN